MRKVLLEIPTHEEVNYIDQSLMAYNHSREPFLQTNPFIPVNRCLKNENGEVIAGVLATLVCWHVLYVDVLWVDPRYRRQGYGSQLLAEAEKVAKALGGYLVHLSTFYFQAKAFYLMCGYEIFGVLEDCPRGHLEYFLKKKL